MEDLKNRKLILIVMGIILCLAISLSAVIIINNNRKLNENIVENTVEVNENIVNVFNENNNNTNKNDTKTSSSDKAVWDFENTSNLIIDDFVNAKWGYHLKDFREYSLMTGEDYTYVIAYDSSSVEKEGDKNIKVIALYDIVKVKHAFPVVISYPVDITISESFFNDILEIEDELEYRYEVENYVFDVISYEFDDIYEELSRVDSALKFVEYPKLGYPMDWIKNDEDSHYRDILSDRAVENPFWEYFNMLEHITLDDGTEVIVKRVNYFESTDFKTTYTLEEISTLNSKARQAYNALKNNEEFLAMGEYMPTTDRDLKEGEQCCSAPTD